MYNDHLKVEIAEEDARAARDQVKAEQDMAYEQTLQADIAKEAARRQKEAAIAAERQRLESEKAEEEARRESIRMVVCKAKNKNKLFKVSKSNGYNRLWVIYPCFVFL